MAVGGGVGAGGEMGESDVAHVNEVLNTRNRQAQGL